MSKLYYKIVSVKDDGTLRSFNYPHDEDEKSEILSLEYKIGEWTYPKVKALKLFCFERKVDAVYYANIMNSVSCTLDKLFTCEVKNPTRDGIFSISLDDLIEDVKNGKQVEYDPVGIPVGTRFCDAIKLVQEVTFSLI